MRDLNEDDFNDIELAASKAMREWERGYVCQDINVRHHISWWIMQETARRVSLSSLPAIGEGSRVPSPHEYAMEYEFRGDGDYTPTDAERTMIEDAICGYLGEVSALRSPPEAVKEPVAWQWRHRAKRQDGTWSDWSDWHEGHKPAMSTDSYEVEERPLYASQPSGQVAADPVAEVRMEADYWSRGHFYKAHRKVAELLKGFSELPVGTKLYASPPDGELVRVRETLREFDCPRPCNDRPDDFTVGQCVDAGECGCGARAALSAKEEQRHG